MKIQKILYRYDIDVSETSVDSDELLESTIEEQFKTDAWTSEGVVSFKMDKDVSLAVDEIIKSIYHEDDVDVISPSLEYQFYVDMEGAESVVVNAFMQLVNQRIAYEADNIEDSNIVKITTGNSKSLYDIPALIERLNT